MYKVFFRADGSSSIGMGHVMRCLSLAKVFSENGYEVFFFSKFLEGKKAINEKGFKVISLSAQDKLEHFQFGFSYGSQKELEIEKQEMRYYLKEYEADILIIDQYNVTEDFFISFKSYVKILAYIDDINAFAYPVDIIINGNITGEYMNYQRCSKEQRFLLGPKYNLIRGEFKNIPKRVVSKKVKKILITTGGADLFHTTESLINIIRSEDIFNEIELHVIIGNAFENKSEIKEKQKYHQNIILYENVEKMSSIMLDCDLALSSCGSTLYELCACGLPTLGFILADNQAFIAKKMNENGYIKNLGWHHQLSIESVIRELKTMIFDEKIREQMVLKQQTLVDGKGTERIVCAIEKMLKEKEGVMHG